MVPKASIHVSAAPATSSSPIGRIVVIGPGLMGAACRTAPGPAAEFRPANCRKTCGPPNEIGMTKIARLLAGNEAYAAARANVADARPSQHLAIVTCMDCRIDVFAALGLHLGEANVIRNAGGRITDDVLRSLALAAHVLGVDTVVVMQHTKCGLAGVTDEELRRLTGAEFDFFSIDDHAAALKEDLDLLVTKPFLSP